MNITFNSITVDETITFDTKAKYLNNVITFYDNNHNLNRYYLNKDNNEIIIKRIGNINSVMHFVMNQKTSFTLDLEGNSFDLVIDCSNILISDTRIVVEYKLILDKNILNNYKIELLMH